MFGVDGRPAQAHRGISLGIRAGRGGVLPDTVLLIAGVASKNAARHSQLTLRWVARPPADLP